MRTPTLLTSVALSLAIGVFTAEAVPTANPDTGSINANQLLTVNNPNGVLSNDTGTGTLVVNGNAPQQNYTFAGFTFDQLSTPNVGTLLGAGTYSNAIVTITPNERTGDIGGFPDSSAGFNSAITLGRLAFGDPTGVRAVNLPRGNNGSTQRSGMELSWNNGLTVTNLAGNDFVVFESGSAGTPEAFMVQVRNAATATWSIWVYNPATAFASVDGAGLFATPFDLDAFGIAANARIDGIRIVNMTNEDRMASASGAGEVIPEDNGATSANLPDVGTLAVDFSNYGAGTLDPDPLYIGILRPMNPGTTAFDVNSVAGAAVNVNPDGTYTYDPRSVLAFQQLAAGQSVNDTFTYNVQDDSVENNSARGTVTITVTGVNETPAGVNDTYVANEDTVLTVGAADGVLDNDTDIDAGTTLTVSAFDASSVQGATVAVSADGSFTYNPNASASLRALTVGQSLTDTFTYTVSDGEGGTDTATVTITVSGRNDAPLAMNDTGYATFSNAPLNVTAPGVLANDTDADGNTLRVEGPGQQLYTFANVVFDQAGTPTILTRLAPGAYNGATIDAEPEDTTTPRDGFPNDTTNFRGAYSLGHLFNSSSSGTTVSGVNLPLGDVGTSFRSGVEITWVNGLSLTNLAGNDFVVYESGSENAPEAFMVQVRGTDSGVWSSWVYVPASESAAYGIAGEFLFATVFNLDYFGISANDRIDAFRIANLRASDRMVAGTNVVIPEDEGATSAILPAPGPLASFGAYGAGTFDPDPVYLGVLHQLVETAPAYSATSVLGATVVVNADGSFSYDPTTSVTLSTLALGVTMDDEFTYTVTDGFGGFSSAKVTVTVTGVNSPPTVSITFPPNNSSFFSPASFTMTATASDVDGTVTQIEFRETIQNISLGTDTTPGDGFSVNLSNLAPGNYSFVAIATDDDNATTTSAAVNITVLANLPLGTVSAIDASGFYFLQSGLMSQSVTVNNTSPVPVSAVRLTIQGLAPGIVVYNASGTNVANEPYMQQNTPVPAGGSVTFFIEYYVANRTTIPAPTFVATLETVAGPVVPVGAVQAILRNPPEVLTDGHVLIDYATVLNRTYYIQYSPDATTWTTVFPAQTGTGSNRQWIDSGPPKTDAHPSTVVSRFYRIVEVP
ncbi:MAG TPA: Ig-like domain-containing protein [Verrucomicrobiae bacterium]